MTKRTRYRPHHKGMVLTLNLRVMALTVRDPCTRQYHKLRVSGARPLSWDEPGGASLTPPLALDFPSSVARTRVVSHHHAAFIDQATAYDGLQSGLPWCRRRQTAPGVVL